MLLFSWKKKKKKKDRGRIFHQWGRQIYARSGKNLLACILSHPSKSETVKDVLFIRRKESTCAKQESWFNKWRIDVAFSSGCTSRRHFGVVARHPSGGGTSPSWRDFPFELTNRSTFIFTGPQAQIPSSPYQQGLGLVRGEALYQRRAWIRVLQVVVFASTRVRPTRQQIEGRYDWDDRSNDTPRWFWQFFAGIFPVCRTVAGWDYSRLWRRTPVVGKYTVCIILCSTGLAYLTLYRPASQKSVAGDR